MRGLNSGPEYSALACGLLSDGQRTLFLKKKDRMGVERMGLPSVWVQKGEDPVRKLAEAFLEQTGIDGHVQEIQLQSEHNIGSRRRKRWIPVLGFKVTAKNAQAKIPAENFSGYCWVSLDEAKRKKLLRSSEWILKI